MKPSPEPTEKLSPEKQALVALRKLKARLETIEHDRTEPIAIVGLGCRFPGAENPAAYWRLLSEGRDAVREVPPGRWSAAEYFDADRQAPGKTYSKWGGFLEGVEQFDAAFFGIAKREAVRMDPQHRLFLEVVWEALEDAGLPPPKLLDANASVFVGLTCTDYLQLHARDLPREEIDAYLVSNNTPNVAAGRISFFLGLHGPSMAIDTACSSSLVAVDRACRSLRDRECNLSIAGGAHLALLPEVFVSMSKWGMLAADGRCKTFDAAADGFVRGEGCGAVILKRLSDAQADGDRILALIRGSAVNQDGPSSALSVPNGLAQQAVIRAALANAGLEPGVVGYVEAHGTGTSLGDPIEVEALGEVFGTGRTAAAPLVIGSVKTNFGHLEAAAGIAGLIKVVLALQHRQIPPHLHFQTPSPHIAWDRLPVLVPTQLTPWAPINGRRIAGLSSFGFSGTNAHAVLEEAPPVVPTAQAVERPLQLLTLSAKTEAALRETARRYEAHLAGELDGSFGDLCFTANSGRAVFGHRLSLVSADAAKARAQLNGFLAGQAPAGVMTSQVTAAEPPKIAFLFTGQGSQYAGMGRQLYDTAPVFKQALDRCDELLRPTLGRSLIPILYPPAGAATPLDETAFTQPALFALEYALSELWRSWGVEPTFVLGHSLGEYVAACVAGVFSLEDGLKLVCERARLMQALPAGGRMAAVRAAEAEVRAAIAPYERTVSIAAINGPRSLVISGVGADVERVLAKLAGAGIQTKDLKVSHAFHSPLMEPMLNDLAQVAAGVKFNAPKMRLIANLTGRVATPDELTRPDYWRQHARAPVQFAASMQTLVDLGVQVCLEIGPNPLLLGMARQCCTDQSGLWLTSLRPGRADWNELLSSAQTLHHAGVDLNWAGFDRPQARRRVALPTYPFERKRCWLEQAKHNPPGAGAGAAAATRVEHPLLGARLDSPLPVFVTEWSTKAPAFLSEHRVHGAVVVPGPMYLEMALAGARQALGREFNLLLNVAIHEPLVLPDEQSRIVQLVFSSSAAAETGFQIFSRNAGDPGSTDWRLHAAGSVAVQRATDNPGDAGGPALNLQQVQARCADLVSREEFYATLRERGIDFGPTLQGVQQLWARDGEALGRVGLSPVLATGTARFHVHPVLLDSCLHVLAGAMRPTAGATDEVFLYVGMEKLQLCQSLPLQLWAHATIGTTDHRQPEARTATLTLTNDAGEIVGRFQGIQLRRATRESLLQATRPELPDWFYEIAWQSKPLHGIRSGDEAAFFPSAQELAAQARDRLLPLGAEHGMAVYSELMPLLDDLSRDFVVETMRRLGCALIPGERLAAESLAGELGVVTTQHRLFRRLLEILLEDGVLRPAAGEFEVVRELPAEAIAERRADALRRFAEQSGEVTMLHRCGSELAAVLRGECNPVQLLFPGGQFAEADKLYRDSPGARTFNALLRDALLAALAVVPASQCVRILEIGAGTGGTTSVVLPSLPEGRFEYVFTDVSPVFLARAKEKFGQFDRVSYELLDVERDPTAQGVTEHHFDVIIAANCLHATTDLRRTLGHVRQLLAPAGLLLLLEGTRAERWVDLTFGLTEGWWKFSDLDLRSKHPLLSRTKWKKLLAELGFVEPTCVPEDGEAVRDSSQQALIVARRPGPLPRVLQPANQKPARGWIIFADETGVGSRLAEQVCARGEPCAVISHTGNSAGSDPESFGVASDDLPAIGKVLRQAVGRAQATSLELVYLWALDAPTGDQVNEASMETAQRLTSTGPLTVMQTIRAGIAPGPSRLWLVTRGAQPVAGIGDLSGFLQAPLWGLGRVFALEESQIKGGLLDLDPAAAPATAAETVLQEVLGHDGEDQVGYRNGRRLAARLQRSPPPAPAGIELRSEKAYLITGGLGGLGLKLARWLVEGGARHLVLAGRKGFSPRDRWAGLAAGGDVRASALLELEQLGARVSPVACDIADRSQVAALFRRLGDELPPLGGIFHAAVDLTTVPLAELTGPMFSAMLRPKVRGTWLLHEFSRELKLDWFVMFSSTTALLGAKGLGHYAAANQFLDAFAHHRATQGLPALVINWGTWEVMRVASDAEQQFFAQSGLRPLVTAFALQALGSLCAAGVVQRVVADVDWAALKSVYEARRQRPFLAKVSNPENAPPPATVAPPINEFRRRLRAAGTEHARELLTEHVREKVAQVLQLEPTEVRGGAEGFFKMGMDSLMTVELRGRLERSLGLKLPTTLAFEYSTIPALSDFLLGALLLESESLAKATSAAKPAPPDRSQSSRPPEQNLDQLAEAELAALLDREVAQFLDPDPMHRS